MKKRANASKLKLDRETLRRLSEVPEEVTGEVVGGVLCSKAATTCASCVRSDCPTC